MYISGEGKEGGRGWRMEEYGGGGGEGSSFRATLHQVCVLLVREDGREGRKVDGGKEEAGK